jgi:hypothetical protein
MIYIIYIISQKYFFFFQAKFLEFPGKFSQISYFANSNNKLCYRYCPAISNRGQYYSQIIRADKLEARPFFFSNFKGTPSQEEHKTIFSSLKINKIALSGQSGATALFSAVCYTL